MGMRKKPPLEAAPRPGRGGKSNARALLGLFDDRRIERNHPRVTGSEEDRIFGPYRVNLLADLEIDLHVVSPARFGLHKKIRDVVKHRVEVKMELALRGILQAFGSTAVLAILEDKAVLCSCFKRHGVPPYSSRTLAAIHCWWAEELLNGGENKWNLIAIIDRLIVFGRNQVGIFAPVGMPISKIHPVLFGVDPDFYSPGAAWQAAVKRFSFNCTRGEIAAEVLT